MKDVKPFMVIGWVFAGIGLLFLVMGVIFVLLGADSLPLLADPEVWLGDTPDELALPMVGIVFSCIGLLFTVMGSVFLFIERRRRLLAEELERFGIRVTGTVSEMYRDRSYNVNGRNPLRIMVQAQHPTTGEMRTLKGPMVWETPLSVGDKLDVLFDPQNEKKFVVKLPEKL